jgi:predicted transcriptional regulator
MRTLTFLFDPTPIQSMRDSFKEAVKTKKPDVEKDIIRFNNFDAISGILSSSKMDLFNSILINKPGSLYELAKIINKDQSQVLRDVKILANLGVVQLVTEYDGGKEKTRPVANYDEIKIIFKKDSDSKVAV